MLIDTNVLVYAIDPAEADKSRIAQHVLERLYLTRRGRLSVQSVGEFVRVATSAKRPLLTPKEAIDAVDRILRLWTVLDITPAIVAAAVRAVRQHRFGYWDAQIWATARVHGIQTILTEDGPDGALVDGVRYINPFGRRFDRDLLG